MRRSPRARLRLLLACAAWGACVAGMACARSVSPGERAAPLPADAGPAPRDAAPRPGEPPAVVDAGPPAPAQRDPDGDDDPEDPGTGAAPATGRFEKVGAPPLALTRICDLTPLGDALYMAHANAPLGTDGATITRYRPTTEGAKRPFSVAFDWNRPGEPTKGGGAGQGFLRVHAIGGRLFVTDADPPYGGLGLVDHGTEGYVFVSDRAGSFAPPRAPSYRPPAAPDLRTPEGRAGAGVLPRAYHVLDAIKWRGALYASTGSVPPKERAWNGPSPGALHRANEDGSRWLYEVDYPFPYQNGVWRLTYMVRFKDRLYAGIQDYDSRDPNDFVYFAHDRDEPGLRREDLHAVRVTPSGAAGTLRWWVDTLASPPRLYWIAWGKDGVLLRWTTDGDTWSVLQMPDGAGRPTDIKRFRDAVVVLTERGLYRVTPEGISEMARVTDKKTPFELTDFFCSAPLAVFDNELYAGGQRGGSLYRLVGPVAAD